MVTTARRAARALSPASLVVLAALLVAPLGGTDAGAPTSSPAELALAASTTAARAVDHACPAGDVPEDGFNDVADGWPHEAAIDCIVWWQVAEGTTATAYAPSQVVTRGQMASFVARLVQRSGGTLPEPSRDHFDDDDGSVHEDSINRLAEAAVVRGTGESTYGPGLPVTRGQLASLLVRAYEHRTGTALPPGDDHFPDDDGSEHEANIDKAAEAGFTEGREDGTYDPAGVARRDQMASFLARVLDLLVEEGHAAPPAPGVSTVLAAGDIASCGDDGDERTAALVEPQAGTVVVPGDAVYEDGTRREYEDCYGPSWGRFLLRTRPAPGNHDYRTPGAAGYFDYFGGRAGERGKGWYSFDLGRWHVVALNSECEHVGGCHAGSEQEQWLRADLAQHPAACTLAFWHHPRFSSGPHGSDEDVAPLWQALYDAGADLVLNGHEHSYERFAPLDPSGAVDAERGVREIVVGTGGKNLYDFGDPHPGSEVRDDDTFGVLRLELAPDGYAWEFLPVAGSSFSDAGSTPCH